MTDSPYRPAAGSNSTTSTLSALASPLPRGGGRSQPLTLAGILFMVVGIGGLAGSIGSVVLVVSGPSDPLIHAMALGGSLASALAQVAVYLVFWRAGFPRRSRGMTFVTLGMSVSYGLILLLRSIGAPMWIGEPTMWALLAVIVSTGILMLLFTISAAGNRTLPRGFRVVPVVQFVLVVTGTIYVMMQNVVLGVGLDVTGVVFLGAGIAYVLLAANTRAALEAASVATEEHRTAPPLTEAQDVPRASSPGARAAAVSVTLSVVGVALSLLLMPPLASKDLTAFFLPPWASATAIGITGAILAAGMILAIVSRVAGRRTIPGYPALDALDLTKDGVHRVYDFYDTSDSGPGQGAYMWGILGPDSEGAFWGESIEDFIPLASSAHYGTWVELKSTVTGEEVGRVTVNGPTDVTDAVEAVSLPDPTHGAFFACEIVLEIERTALAEPDAAIPLPSVLFDTPRGTHYSVGLPPDGSVPGYPTMEEVTGTEAAGKFTYYDMFDIPPDMADTSPCVMFLAARGGGLDYTIDFGPE